MKIIEIKKKGLEISKEDWSRLSTLYHDFSVLCETLHCDECPMKHFCENVDRVPREYLSHLISYLDENN